MGQLSRFRFAPLAGDNGTVIEQAGYINSYKLLAGVPRLIVPPVGAAVAVFSPSAPFWARMDGAAAVPTADVVDGSGSEYTPGARTVTGSFGVVAATDCILNVSYFREG